jgi:hypothetical protein
MSYFFYIFSNEWYYEQLIVATSSLF